MSSLERMPSSPVESEKQKILESISAMNYQQLRERYNNLEEIYSTSYRQKEPEKFIETERPELKKWQELEVKDEVKIYEYLTRRSLEVQCEEGNYRPLYERRYEDGEHSIIESQALVGSENTYYKTKAEGTWLFSGLYRPLEKINDPGNEPLVKEYVIEQIRQRLSNQKTVEYANKFSASQDQLLSLETNSRKLNKT